MVGAFQLCGFIGLRINASPSLPIGIYVTSKESRASLVEFCPSAPFASLAIARGYRDQGTCQDGGAPLLKPVVARAGDLVEVSAQGIAVNGRFLPNTVPLQTDIQGRSLTAWQPGRYIVAPDTVWVVSSYNQRSFDSRYFGPVASSAVRNHVRPLVTLP
jgi:conjugative transfer signal peptidase TraF